RCRNRLATEARNETVIASTASNRTEADDFALIVRHFEQKLCLVDRAGIIFEATHDRRVDLDAAIVVASSSDKRADLREFLDAFIAFDFAGLNVAKHGLDRSLFKASALGEVAAFVETPLAEQEANAFRTKLV